MRNAHCLAVLVVVALGTASVPFWGSGYSINLLTQVFLFGFLAAAWNFMALTGLVSLGHAAFFGVGGYATAWLYLNCGANPVFGATTGAVLAMFLAFVVFWMAFRTGLRGIYFSGMTLVLAEALRFAAINTPALGRSQGLELVSLHLPDFLLYGISVTLLVLTVGGTWWLLRSPLGYGLQAVRENEGAAEALGVNTFRVKLAATLLSAGLVAIGGALNAAHLRFVEPESDFGLQLSLNLLLGTFLGGTGTVLGPPIGIIVLFALREGIARLGEFLALGSSEIYAMQQVLYGALLMLVVVALPEGLVRRVYLWWSASRRAATGEGSVGLRAGGRVASTGRSERTPARPSIPAAPKGSAGVLPATPLGLRAVNPAPLASLEPAAQPRPGRSSAASSPYLQVIDVSRSFHGVTALVDVSFCLHQGEILGLIGPNGAGKTTMFNVISGIVPAHSGEVRHKGEQLSGLAAHQVCRRGVARTFQIVQPFSGLTVLENALIGALSRYAWIADAREAALAALAQVDLHPKRDLPATSLTLQDRKMLEFARALATGPELILLDEVMAGLNQSEQARVADKILEIRDTGVSFLLVEHAMRAVMRLSDRIVVLDHGKVIATGLPSNIARDPGVISVYLGRSQVHTFDQRETVRPAS
jgi:branched-chain amino acid transport system permease protein